MEAANVVPIKHATEKDRRTSACPSEEVTAVLTLDDDGRICDCNPAAAHLLNCLPSKVVWKHISTIVPQFAETALVQGGIINPNLRFLSHIGYQFDLVGLGGVHIACALFFNEVEDFGRHCLRMIIRPVNQEYALT